MTPPDQVCPNVWEQEQTFSRAGSITGYLEQLSRFVTAFHPGKAEVETGALTHVVRRAERRLSVACLFQAKAN